MCCSSTVPALFWSLESQNGLYHSVHPLRAREQRYVRSPLGVPVGLFPGTSLSVRSPSRTYPTPLHLTRALSILDIHLEIPSGAPGP